MKKTPEEVAVPDHRTRSIPAAERGGRFVTISANPFLKRNCLRRIGFKREIHWLLAGDEEFAAEKQDFAVREYISKNNPCRYFFVYMPPLIEPLKNSLESPSNTK